MGDRFSRRQALALAAAWPLPAAAFDMGGLVGARGSGRVVQREIDLEAFDAIEVAGTVALTLVQAQAPRLTIETDDNLVERIEAKVAGGTLKLAYRGNLRPTKLRLAVAVWQLERVAVAGSAKVEAETLVCKHLQLRANGSALLKLAALTAEDLAVHVGGSAVVRVAGRANELDATAGGSGVIDAAALQVRRVSVDIGGSGIAKVWAGESLTGDVGGAGQLRYRGDAAVSVSKSGGGRIRKI